MGELVAAVVLLALIAGCVAGLAWAVDGHRRHQERRARWEVGEVGSTGATQVFIRRVAADGREMDRVTVAQVGDGDPDWSAVMANARAEAASRAALLNAAP